MFSNRLSAALREGALPLPQGTPLIVAPDSDADLSAFDTYRVMTHDAIVARRFGNACVPEMETAPLVTVCLPREKEFARHLIADAVQYAQEMVIVDGAKTDGVDGIWRELRKLVPNLCYMSKAHGRLMWFSTSESGFDPRVFEGWRDPGRVKEPENFITQSGVFSAGKIDGGSRLLATSLPDKLGAHVADFGAGWGFLSRHMVGAQGLQKLDLVETNMRALECARTNVQDVRCRFHWDDATIWRPDAPLDAIVMNPPFHTGRRGVPDLGIAFIKNAAACLKPRGELWMVANRHLPYEASLDQAFLDVGELDGDAKFKIFHAKKPRR